MLGWIKNYARVSIEKPHLGRAFFFFLLPFILTLVVAFLIGISVNVMNVGYNIFLALVAWLLSAVVLFVVVHLFKGHEVSGKFKGIFAGLAFRYFFWFLLMLLVFVVLFFAMPEFFQIVAKAQKAQTADEAFTILGNNADQIAGKNALVLFASFGIIMLGVAAMLFLTLYLVYELINFCGTGSPRQSLLILFIWIALQGLILALIGTV
ncbi:MAG: hypothetical protein AABW85_02730 [archaeon]